MSIEAMKQALEALEESHPEAYRNVITSLRQAIAEAQDIFEAGRQQGIKQEHAMWMMSRAGQEIERVDVSDISQKRVDETHKSVHEPVAMRYDFDGYGWKYIDSGSGSDWQTRIKDAEPVYAAPQRQWVGLTEEEYEPLRNGLVKEGKPLRWFAEQLEAKLKEKNT